ncbi:MAG: hypothetical protein ACI9LM_002513 [Alteromonadaceae bacterium]|jgi:hypothetical protein
MKKTSLFSILIVIGLLIAASLYFTNIKNKELVLNQSIDAISSAKPQGDQEDKTQLKQLAFSYKITTDVINNHDQLLSSSVLQGNIALKKVTDQPHWLGQIVAAQLIQQDKIKKLQPEILFTTAYDNFVFENVDLLALNSSHPVNAVRYLLSHLSYQLNRPLLIENATGSVSYQYQLDNNQVSRSIHTRNEQQSQVDLAVTNITEHWQLSLADNHFPTALNSSVKTSYQNQTGQFVVKQTIVVNAIDIQPNWQVDKYVSDANGDIVFQTQALNSVIDIRSEQALLQALNKLASLHDDALAKAIGKYLIEHYSIDDIAELLNQQSEHTQLASLIIYSIQQNPSFAAEVVLVDLLAHPDIAVLNKHRLIMSLGRFKAVTDLSLNELKTLTAQPNNDLANTAQLSIGSVVKYNQDQQANVSQFLSKKLSRGDNKAVTLLAIHNSGLNELNEQAVKLLGDKSANVNIALIKLLANDPQYHNEIVNFAINSKQAKSISALSRALANNKLVLTSNQKERITAQIKQSSNPLIKDQLTALLHTDKKQW